MLDNNILLHKKILLQAKIWKLLFVFSIFVIFVQSVTVLYITKKVNEKKVPPTRYIEFSKIDNLGFKVIPANDITIEQKKAIAEQQLFKYVQNRIAKGEGIKYQGFDEVDSYKIKFISALSSRKVYGQFIKEFERLHKEAEFKERKIKILSFSEIDEQKYRFDFETYDSYRDSPDVINRWVVYIRYEFVSLDKLTDSEQKLNPLGIKIVFYSGNTDNRKKSVREVKNAIY